MFSFLLSLVALVLGYWLYGRFVESIFRPEALRVTPAVAHPDGVDFIALPSWKVFMIQFLNIAGTGPIFGAIMGAKFGPSAYLWIVLGCIFAGSVHDYMVGMLSLRHDGAGLPDLVGKYLGRSIWRAMLAFSLFLLLMVGVVFVYSPALILGGMCSNTTVWVLAIFAYYVLATMLPIDKIIGRVYPLFAGSLLFMAAALMIVLLLKWPSLPELWDGLGNRAPQVDPSWTDNIFPCLFITIACGALSGFHATQSPLMARCLTNERQGRPIFYGAMITEGIVALVWATVAMYFFYDSPAPGYEAICGAGNKGFATAAPAVVQLVCTDWLGWLGGLLAILGVVAAPITSGDTAFRSARLLIADAVKLPQQKIRNRLIVCLPMFAASIALLLWQVDNPSGFNIIWQYFGWANQTLAVFALWTATAYLVRRHTAYWFTLLPALFMTDVCCTYFFVSHQMLGLPATAGYTAGGLCTLAAGIAFLWARKIWTQEGIDFDRK